MEANKILQDLYDKMIWQANQYHATAQQLASTVLYDTYEDQSKGFEWAAIYVAEAALKNKINIQLKTSVRQLEIEQANREEMVSSFSHEGREEGEE